MANSNIKVHGVYPSGLAHCLDAKKSPHKYNSLTDDKSHKEKKAPVQSAI